MKKALLNKYKQAGRRELRKQIEGLTYTMFLNRFLKPKPKHLPTFIWVWVVKKVIKNSDEYNSEQHDQITR